MSAVTLTLMRHAKSSWQNPGQSDHDRPLNDRGNRDAPVMASRLMQRGGIPDLILSSSSRRTRETDAHLLDVFGEPRPEVQFEKSLYLASPEDMLKVLEGVPDTVAHVLILAHNPGIEELSAYLAGISSDSMPTAALRQFSCYSFNSLRAFLMGHASTGLGSADMNVELVYADYPKNPVG